MKVHYLLLAFFFLLSCQSEKKPTLETPPTVKKTAPKSKVEKTPSPWEYFWTTFKKAIAEGDVETIIESTVFPLPGSEPLNNGKMISKATFEQHFSKLFDAKALETIAASTNNMSEFATKSKIVGEQLNVPIGVKIRSITVFYVSNEGKENQTESSTTFHFAETTPNIFKLVSIILAG